MNLQNLKYHLLKQVGDTNYQPFIIMSTARTGSNLLMSYLHSHPDVICRGEVFQRLNGRSYENILNQHFGKQPSYIKATGFKIFYLHPLDTPDCPVWHDLVAIENLRVIHLTRRNLLRSIVSRKIAHQQDVWKNTKVKKSDGAEKRVSFQVDELVYWFETLEKWEREGDTLFKNHNTLKTTYEDLVNDTSNQFQRITDFLGVSSRHTPHSMLKKQNPEPLSRLIVNYDELLSAFTGGPWAYLFKL